MKVITYKVHVALEDSGEAQKADEIGDEILEAVMKTHIIGLELSVVRVVLFSTLWFPEIKDTPGEPSESEISDWYDKADDYLQHRWEFEK